MRRLTWSGIGVGAEVLRWLSAADPVSSHEAARKLWQDETGLWLIHGADYIAWRDGASPMLWLYGIRKRSPAIIYGGIKFSDVR